VKVETFLGGSQLGNPTRLWDSLNAGVVDIASGLSGIPAGQFERTRIIELPFMAKTAKAATMTLSDMYDEYLAEDFPGVKMLVLHASNANPLHLAKEHEPTLEGLKGLRLRFPSDSVKQMIEALNAVPAGMPPGELYESLERGVIEGAFIGWDTLQSFKLGEVTEQTVDTNLYTITFWFAMNQRSYDALPDDVKVCIDKSSGPILAAKFGEWWDKWDEGGRNIAEGTNHEVSPLSPEEQAKWEKALAPLTAAYLKALEAKGINARVIYDKMKEKIAEYE